MLELQDAPGSLESSHSTSHDSESQLNSDSSKVSSGSLGSRTGSSSMESPSQIQITLDLNDIAAIFQESPQTERAYLKLVPHKMSEQR